MSIVFADISVSADGFLAGPNPGHEHPLGMNGERLHEWIMDLYDWRASHGLEGGTRGAESNRMLASFESAGAFIMGRTMFETGEAPWGDDPPFHHTVPVLIGDGMPLFTGLGTDHIELKRMSSLTGENGLVHTRYRIAPPPSGD